MSPRGPFSSTAPKDPFPGLSGPLGRELFRAIRSCRWYAGKDRSGRTLRIVESIPWPVPRAALWVLAREVRADGTEGSLYSLPLRIWDRKPPSRGRRSWMARIPKGGCWMTEALEDPRLVRDLLEIWAGQRVAPPPWKFESWSPRFRALSPRAPLRAMGGDQSNTLLRVGRSVVLKVYRRPPEGPNPDAELLRHLAVFGGPSVTPALWGTIRFHRPRRPGIDLAIATEFRDGQEGAWDWVVKGLRKGRWSRRPPEDLLYDLARATAELHGALGRSDRDPAFRPELYAPRDVQEWKRAFSHELRWTRDMVQRASLHVPRRPGMARAARVFLRGSLRWRSLDRELYRAVRGRLRKVRIHGDLHLGQILRGRKGVTILDFEGEPSRPLSERRAKMLVLRDVAGVLRSLDYALRQPGIPSSPDSLSAGERSYQWQALFLRHYHERVPRSRRLLPPDLTDLAALLAPFLVQKILYEIRYELENRPSWVGVPLITAAEWIQSGQIVPPLGGS